MPLRLVGRIPHSVAQHPAASHSHRPALTRHTPTNTQLLAASHSHRPALTRHTLSNTHNAPSSTTNNAATTTNSVRLCSQQPAPVFRPVMIPGPYLFSSLYFVM